MAPLSVMTWTLVDGAAVEVIGIVLKVEEGLSLVDD